MIRKLLIAALGFALGAPAFAAQISTYPAASTLTGAETMIGTQSATTVNISANQLNTFIAAAVKAAGNVWATTQTFTVAPVFTDQAGTRTALGLGTFATQNYASPPAIGSVTPAAGTFTGLNVTGLTASVNVCADVSKNLTSTCTNEVALANLAQIGTNTVLGNSTAGTANVTALAVGSCSTAASALIWTTNTGPGCNTSINAAQLGGATFAAPGAIGGTTPAAITGTTITANTAFSGPINGAVGATTPNTGAFTTLSASSTVSGAGFSTYLASPPAIGGTAAAAGTFSALTDTAMTGGPFCVHETSGAMTAAAADCGAGGANPSAGVGLAAVNGVATTFMRSDAAPALSQSISPTWTGTHTFTNSLLKLLGSSTGATTLTSANAGASNFTLTLPAATDTLAVLGTSQTWTALQTFSAALSSTNVTTTSSSSADCFGGGSFCLNASQAAIQAWNGAAIGWIAGSTDSLASVLDTGFNRRAAANISLGLTDAAAPVAQTLSVPNVVAGTTNTAGANFTVSASQGTGTGVGGSIIFKVAPAGTTGTAQNALTAAVTIDSTKNVTVAGLTSGGTQCVQASSTGVLSGTGAVCGGSGASGANPTATIGTAAVNGVATTFMRSDAAPAFGNLTGDVTSVGMATTYGNIVGVAKGGSGVANTGNLTWNAAQTFSFTTGLTMTFPATSATIARTDAAQSFTGAQTFATNIIDSALTASVPVCSDASKNLTSTCTNLVTNALRAQMAANTVKANATSGTANEADFAMPSCSAATSALNWTTGTGFTCGAFTTAATTAIGTSGATIPLLSTANTWSLTQTFANSAQTTPNAVTFSATAMTLNAALSNVFTTTFTANVTTAPTVSNPGDGQTINWFITQDATGSRTMTWPTSFKWPGGTAGVLSTAVNAIDLLVCTYRAGTTAWYCSLSKAFS